MRIYLQRSAPIQPKTTEILPKIGNYPTGPLPPCAVVESPPSGKQQYDGFRRGLRFSIAARLSATYISKALFWWYRMCCLWNDESFRVMLFRYHAFADQLADPTKNQFNQLHCVCLWSLIWPADSSVFVVIWTIILRCNSFLFISLTSDGVTPAGDFMLPVTGFLVVCIFSYPSNIYAA